MKKRDYLKTTLFIICCIAIVLSFDTDISGESPLGMNRSAEQSEYSDCSALLTVVSDTGESESRHGMPCYGHTFLVLENTGESPLIFCGREIEPNENLTFGWWTISSHSGVWFSIEANYINSFGRYPDRVALSREIDGGGIARLSDYILTHDLYTPFENCALRAIAAFNAAIPEVRQLKAGHFVTPARAVDTILAEGGSHEAAMEIEFSDQTPSCGFGDAIEYYDLAARKEKE